MPDLNTPTLPGDSGATPVTSTPTVAPPSPSPAPAKAAPQKSSFSDALGKIPEFKPAEKAKETPQDESETQEPTKMPTAAPDTTTAKQTPKAKGSIAHEQFEALGNDMKIARAEKTALEAKIKDYESRGNDTGALEAELASVKKDRDEKMAQLAQYNPAVTEEFQKEFDEPFERLKAEARESLEYFRTIDPETGEQTGPPATWDDFSELYGMKAVKAGEYAARKWGTNAAYIIKHVLDLKQLSARRQSSLDGAAKIAETKFKQGEAQRQANEKVFSDSLAQFNQETIAAEPDIYNMAAAGEDDEGNTVLTEAIKEIANRGNTPQEYAKWMSKVQLRAAAFPRVNLRLKRATAKVVELEGVIEKMKGLAVGKGGKPTASAEPTKSKGLLAGVKEIS